MRKLRTITGVIAAAALALSACTDTKSPGSDATEGSKESAVVMKDSIETQSVAGDAAAQSGGAAKALFDKADAVVLAPAGDAAAQFRAASIGRALGIPTLAVSDADAGQALQDLKATAAVLVGDVKPVEAEGITSYRAPAKAADLAKATGLELKGAPAPSEPTVAALAELGADTVIEGAESESSSEESGPATLGKGDIDVDGPLSGGPLTLVTDEPSSLAAAANAMAAGSQVRVVTGDFRGSSDAIADVKKAEAVLALGESMPATDDFAWQVEVAKSGKELPGGGQLMFANKRYVALYGTPVTDSLGVLGEQGTEETIERAKKLAAQYQELTEDTVVPALEIIVTVASGKAGDDGNYSNEWDIKHFKPLIEAAEAAGQYVVIDFQPGRADFLTQVKQYEELLKYPHVGIALDPEWRLGPEEKPLTRIGHVEIDEVNQVIDYVAEFTKENKLPQKMVILHQFQVQMLRDRANVKTDHPEVAVLIHADGQGSQPQKNDTWRTLLKDAPEGVHWGWKNFIDEDHPMLTPEQTYRIEPQPDFVSYQ